MCLYIKKNDQHPIKVAETDIVCYKILEEYETNISDTVFDNITLNNN